MDRIAIVIPCYNEEQVLVETSACLNEVLNHLIDEGLAARNSFLLFVDDGSQDLTWSIIEGMHQNSARIYGLKLSANVGHQNALLAGLMKAMTISDAIISIDADLQDDVQVIREMILKYKSGDDIIYGVRESRKTDTFIKRNTAQLFYKLMRLLGVKTIFNHADFRLMSRRSLEYLGEFEERNLFLRGLLPLIGYRTSQVYYERKARKAGESKYPLKRMLNFALDGITSFSIKPLRMIFGLGFIILGLSIAALVYTLYSYFAGRAIPGWTSLIISVWFLGAIILISIGVVGEYIGKIYTETKNRPRYNVETFLTHENKI